MSHIVVYKVNTEISHTIDSEKLINYDDTYDFCFIDYGDKSKFLDHPLKDCYLCARGLSFKVNIKAKWLNWAVFFFKKLSEEISENNFVFDKNIIQTIIHPKKGRHILSIALEGSLEKIIECTKDISDLLVDCNANTPMLLTLKLNLDEYIRLSSVDWPCFVKIIENKYRM